MKSAFAIIAVVGILAATILFGGMAYLGSTQPKPDMVSRDQLNNWQQTASWWQSQSKQLEADRAAIAERNHALEMQLQSERDNNKTTMAVLAAHGQDSDSMPWLIAGGVVVLGGALALVTLRKPQAQQQPIIIQLPQQTQYAQLSDGRIAAIEAEVAQIKGGINQITGYIEGRQVNRVQIKAPQGEPLQLVQRKSRGQIAGPQ